MPSAERSLDVTRYANEAMQRLVSTTGSEQNWRQVVERGLDAAHEQSDVAGLVSMVQLVAQLLEGDGRFEDGLEEIEHALAFARGSADAAVILCGIKASMFSAMGRFAEAHEALARGESSRAESSDDARVRLAVFRKITLWQEFIDDSQHDTSELLANCREQGMERERTFLLSWYVPWLAALGQRRKAHPYIREMRLEAARSVSFWRQSDAAAFELWDHFFGDPRFNPEADGLDRRNAMSIWRGESVRLRHAVLAQDVPEIDDCLLRLTKARRRLASAQVGPVEGFAAGASIARSSLVEPPSADPPKVIPLAALGAVIAEAESVAHRGSQHAAAAWLDQLTSLIPPAVRSTMVWPVSVPRVLGLLAVRAGDSRRALQLLRSSLEWTENEGFGIEHALTRLQLGELCASADVKVPERTWRAYRREGAAALEARGYSPLPHVYAVAHSLTLSGRNRLAERLTPREVQVLALLVEGKSYREVALELSVATPTVQTLAHRVYQKLGVSGRDAAASEAKRLGVL